MSGAIARAAPYKGLVPYGEEDAFFFFGREAERELITANLMASRLTLLYGESGVGKTSVLNAGVVHDLRGLARRNLAERGSCEVAVVLFNSWRDDPAGALIQCVENSVRHLLNGDKSFPASRSRLVDALEAWTDSIDGDLLIILDQFEEYFLYHNDDEGADSFALEFAQALNRADLRANFLISIREDALAKLDRFKGRIPILFDNYLRVAHLDLEAARAAIENPVEQYNRLLGDGQRVSIEPGLTDAVLEQVRIGRVILAEAGAGATPASTDARIEAPYLQLVMTKLWDEEVRGGSSALRLDTLERLGGAERVVRTHLDEAMTALEPADQDIAAEVFRYLVTPSGTKVAHTIPDLAEYARLTEGQLGPVLEKLSAREVRILRPVAPPPDRPRAPRYEIFHDVLAAPILDWRLRHLQARERARVEELAQRRRRRAQFALGVVGCLLALLIVSRVDRHPTEPVRFG